MARPRNLAPFFEDTNPLLAHTGTPGYLGVDVTDVDADKAQTLKLKEVRGAVITLIDHDAPAGQIGLKVNDVVLGIDGQNCRRRRSIAPHFARDSPRPQNQSRNQPRRQHSDTGRATGRPQRMEKAIWAKIGIGADGISPLPPSGMGMLPGSGSAPVSGGFHMSLFTGTLNVGALVEPLTSQMAEYLGVPGGLMVKQVAKKSEAAAAGLKAFDVILKVGADSIATSADWDRALRSNVGKPVQVTILRDKKQQQLNLQVDSKHRGAVEHENLFAPGNDAIEAGLSPLVDFNFARAKLSSSALRN